ncbi:MAG TPA: sulfite exporter TauE/SafE family protein, partial [Candidatus Acidoferrum sp.]|nr:sulfite exporter TauE/SafE family protein [Candidatus Acidoferrum sp.]
MCGEITVLAITAASVGLFHTLLGPDHYLPFIVMARARGWSVAKTAWITILCGVGHVGSSILLGLIGVGLGIGVSRLSRVESLRGSLAAWALMAFGLVYLVWGLRRAARNRPHTHWHGHGDGIHHAHEHAHAEAHVHAHDGQGPMSLTPWILFTIFIFGPCEPLIPLVMYPAARHSVWGTGIVAGIFGVTTILTMVGIVTASTLGVTLVPARRLERYHHALAGG